MGVVNSILGVAFVTEKYGFNTQGYSPSKSAIVEANSKNS